MKRSSIALLLVTLFLVFMSNSCDEKIPKPAYSLDGDFATNIFKAILNSEAEDKNVVISPLSISTVTKMILAGADENTKSEIEDAYGKNVSSKQLVEDAENYLNWLKNREGSPIIELSNAFFYDKDNFNPLTTYKASLSQYFNASEFAEDFSNEEKALASLNGWVSEKTNERIPKILETINPDEVMFLVNALYLKADWKEGFVEDYTQPADFTLTNGNTSKVDMMYADRTINYFGDNDLEAIEIPYKDDEISMYLFRPKDGDLDGLISDFNFSKFDKISAEMKASRYMVYVPKFKVKYKNEEVKNSLMQLGIKDAFSNGANLSNMAEEKNISISRVVHKTYLSIDEKGTEGAAVTVGGVVLTSLPPKVAFNSPFVFVIADNQSKNMLFMGRISNPSEE